MAKQPFSLVSDSPHGIRVGVVNNPIDRDMSAHPFTYPSSSVRREMPVNLAPDDRACFEREKARSFPRVESRLLHDITISSEGICTIGNRFLQWPVLLTLGMPLTVSQYIKSGLLLTRRAASGLQARRPEHVQRALLLSDIYFDGFFHWFGDILPKLEAFVASCRDVTGYTVVVPASRNASYVTESLAAYTVDYRVIPKGHFLRADELHFIPRLTPTGNYRPELMHAIHRRLCTKHHAVEDGTRLYIARANAPKRRLLNEREVTHVFDRHGFQSVQMENLPFSEQVKLASRCRMIAGLHGAGLTNMLWAQGGTSILEIRGATETRNNCFYSLASDLGHRYYYVPARQVSPLRKPHLSDYIVNVQLLDATLERLVEDAAQQSVTSRDADVHSG